MHSSPILRPKHGGETGKSVSGLLGRRCRDWWPAAHMVAKTITMLKICIFRKKRLFYWWWIRDWCFNWQRKRKDGLKPKETDVFPSTTQDYSSNLKHRSKGFNPCQNINILLHHQPKLFKGQDITFARDLGNHKYLLDHLFNRVVGNRFH